MTYKIIKNKGNKKIEKLEISYGFFPVLTNDDVLLYLGKHSGMAFCEKSGSVTDIIRLQCKKDVLCVKGQGKKSNPTPKSPEGDFGGQKTGVNYK